MSLQVKNSLSLPELPLLLLAPLRPQMRHPVLVQLNAL
jgi:hypothetical protein